MTVTSGYSSTDSGLLVPKKYVPRNVQMTKAVVFWRQADTGFIMLPPSPTAHAPRGFEKIECIHAHEVDKWSALLRAQEERIRLMTDEERANFELPIQAAMLRELKENLSKATDEKNRLFLVASIKLIEERRAKMSKCITESFMHCEAKEGVAS